MCSSSKQKLGGCLPLHSSTVPLIARSSLQAFSHGPHAKRSQLLFELAFENKVKIGIIASKSLFFNSEKWWTSSEGVRTLLDEIIAYPYALFFKYTHLGSL
jgi:hypothetical protein